MDMDNPIERRREERILSNDPIRWKRPGRIEDQKGWMIDSAASGMGFLTLQSTAPQIGDVLNVRRQDGNRWATVDQTVRVARSTPTTNGQFAMVGCTVQ